MNLRADEKDKFQEYLKHEFNTSLTVIKGYAEILQDSTKDDPELTRYLKKILENAERLERIPESFPEELKVILDPISALD